MKKEQAECQARAVHKVEAGGNTLQCDDCKSKQNIASVGMCRDNNFQFDVV